jgi:hypothetical protein
MDEQDRLQDEQINRKTEKERHFAEGEGGRAHRKAETERHFADGRGGGGHIGRLRQRDNLLTGEGWKGT